MSTVVTALLCSAGALALASRMVRVPPCVEFPQPPKDPNKFIDERSAHVSVAHSFRADAEASRDKAEAKAGRLGKAAERLTEQNAALTKRMKIAEARIVALEEMKLATAIEMVAAMGKTAAEQQTEGGEGEDESSAAASAYKPDPAPGPR